MPSCAAYGCYNARGKPDCKGISFFRFPLKNSHLIQTWLTKLRRKDFIPTPNSLLCSAHFEPECFRYQPFTNTRLLQPNAVPTKFSYAHKRAKRGRLKNRETLATTSTSLAAASTEQSVTNSNRASHVTCTPSAIWRRMRHVILQPQQLQDQQRTMMRDESQQPLQLQQRLLQQPLQQQLKVEAELPMDCKESQQLLQPQERLLQEPLQQQIKAEPEDPMDCKESQQLMQQQQMKAEPEDPMDCKESQQPMQQQQESPQEPLQQQIKAETEDPMDCKEVVEISINMDKPTVPAVPLTLDAFKSQFTLLPEAWCYISRPSEIIFICLDRYNLKEKISFAERREIHLKERITSFDHLHSYICAVEKFALCTGTGMEVNRHASLCMGIIDEDEKYKRQQYTPRCKACRVHRQRLQTTMNQHRSNVTRTMLSRNKLESFRKKCNRIVTKIQNDIERRLAI